MKTVRLAFDANAGMLRSDAAWKAYRQACDGVGTPHSAHGAGRHARKLLEQARECVATAVNARPDEVVFTSGGTEADALALSWPRARGQPHVIASAIEHAAVAGNLEQAGAIGRLTWTSVSAERDGCVDVAAFKEAVTAETVGACLVLASNETGVVQPVAEVAAALAPIPLHTDAVQATGRLPLDFRGLGVATLALSGHKIGAVGGVGALVVRRGHCLRPRLGGSGHEAGRRAGTPNVPGAVSLAAALRHNPWEYCREHVAICRDRFERMLAEALDGVEVLGQRNVRLCNTSCVRFDGCAGDGLMMALDLEGVAVSTGSACSTGSIDPSPVLLGMGVSPKEAQQTLRFSFGWDVTPAAVDRLVEHCVDVVRRLRLIDAAPL